MGAVLEQAMVLRSLRSVHPAIAGTVTFCFALAMMKVTLNLSSLTCGLAAVANARGARRRTGCATPRLATDSSIVNA